MLALVRKSSQSQDFDFFRNFSLFFRFFFRYFDLKKGPNCPKVCLKCKILTKRLLEPKESAKMCFLEVLQKKSSHDFDIFGILKKVKVMSSQIQRLFSKFQKSQSHDLT